MSGNPTNQAFSCTMQTDFPATVLGEDVVALLNKIPSGALNDVIGAALSCDFFLSQGLDITASSATDSKWISQNGNAALQYTLNTTSDPVTASEVEAAILVGAGVLAAAIVAGGLLAGVAPGLILLGLFVTGVLAFIAVIVVAIGGVVSSSAGQFLLYVGGAAAIGLISFAAYQYFKNPEVKRNVNKAAGRLSKRAAAYA
jgi:hypothetical protein